MDCWCSANLFDTVCKSIYMYLERHIKDNDDNGVNMDLHNNTVKILSMSDPAMLGEAMLSQSKA